MRRILAALTLLLGVILIAPVGSTAAYLTQTTSAPVGTLTLPSFGAGFADESLTITLPPGAWQVVDIPVVNANAATTTWGLRIRLDGTPEETAALRSAVALDSIIVDCGVRSWSDFESSVTVAGKVGPGYRYPSEPSLLAGADTATATFYFLNTGTATEALEVPFTLEIISAEPAGWQRGALWDSPRTDHCQSSFDPDAGSSIPGRIAVRSISGAFVIPPAG